MMVGIETQKKNCFQFQFFRIFQKRKCRELFRKQTAGKKSEQHVDSKGNKWKKWLKKSCEIKGGKFLNFSQIFPPISNFIKKNYNFSKKI